MRGSLCLPLVLCVACSGSREVERPDWLQPGKSAPRPLSADETRRYRACEQDTDCVVVVNGCCDCANGGEDIAVQQSQRDAFRALFDCSHTPCTEMAALKPCGSGTTRCQDKLCVYDPPR